MTGLSQFPVGSFNAGLVPSQQLVPGTSLYPASTGGSPFTAQTLTISQLSAGSLSLTQFPVGSLP